VEEVVEPASPVGKVFGKEDNVGEGIVVSVMYNDSLQIFKVKGDKHSNSRVKKLAKVDDIKLQKIRDVAQQVTPAWRLEQMYTEANDLMNDGHPKTENIGKFMKLLNTDIIKEESDVIKAAGLEPREIFKTTSIIAREWYINELNNS